MVIRTDRCACGKVAFATRADAKMVHPKKRVYLCGTGAYHTQSKVSRRQRR